MLSAGRTADLQWFHFGTPRVVANSCGATKTVGDYALHVQCAWRIRTDKKIIVASRDRYEPANGDGDEDFDWDKPGANVCDLKITKWLSEIPNKPLTVIRVTGDDVGGLRLTLADDSHIEVFPDTSLVDEYAEYWRFFRPSDGTKHLVVTGLV